MSDSIKLPMSFNARLMRQDLDSISRVAWIDHFVQQNYEGSWTVIPLRGPAHASHPVQMIYSDPGCTEFSDTPFLNQCPYLREVLAVFRCPLNAVRLMKLTAGSSIKEHTDYDLSLDDDNVRLHIPITTNGEIDFRLNGRRIVMTEGECWYLRLSDPHSVSNDSNQDRVHLVIDASVNAWLLEIIDSAVQHLAD